ncbi:MAG TPA: hypothetical protein ENN69_02805, partial [Spirochaetia bacterium]|nr:hypothetical protein [Spirochaetia bacterium]
MKRFLMLLLILCVTAAAFAQEEKPKSELYGKFRLDWDMTQANAEADPVKLGVFNFDRVRFGFTTLMAANLKALLELELKPGSVDVEDSTATDTSNFFGFGKFELRIVSVEW